MHSKKDSEVLSAYAYVHALDGMNCVHGIRSDLLSLTQACRPAILSSS